jgi:hypothetical protein
MKAGTLEVGDIVQLGPDCGNKAFAYCLMVVTERKLWGAQGFVQALGDSRDEMGGQAFCRCVWQHMERTGGKVQWAPEDMTRIIDERDI